MAEKKKSKVSPERFMIVGLLVALVFTLGGFAIASGAPSSIHTCTGRGGRIRVAAGTCKPGRQTSDTWDNHEIVAQELADRDARILALRTAICHTGLSIFQEPGLITDLQANHPAVWSEISAQTSLAVCVGQ
jgi:hypothetical protein